MMLSGLPECLRRGSTHYTYSHMSEGIGSTTTVGIWSVMFSGLPECLKRGSTHLYRLPLWQLDFILRPPPLPRFIGYKL